MNFINNKKFLFNFSCTELSDLNDSQIFEVMTFSTRKNNDITAMKLFYYNPMS